MKEHSELVQNEIREAYQKGFAEAKELAAKVLDDEVKRHRRDSFTHEFCEDYGCYSLEEFAVRIRALEQP